MLVGNLKNEGRAIGGLIVERIMVFIDGMNFRRAWISVCTERGMPRRTRFDVVKLRNLLSALSPDREVVRIHYYSSTIPPKDSKYYNNLNSIDPRGFNGMLKRKGYKCFILKNRVRHEKCPLCGERFPIVKEKGVDVMIALDMMMKGIENAFDVALLVSGDADFIPVVNLLTKKGKKVEVAQFSNAISWFLRKSVNRVYDLDGHFDGLVLK